MNYTARKQVNRRIRRHALLTEELKKKLPPLNSTDGQGEQAIAQIKYFAPDSSWYWYATEFDGEDIFFGLVFGPFVELGDFSLTELETTRGPLGLPIERDLYFKPKTLAEVKQEHRKREGAIRQY